MITQVSGGAHPVTRYVLKAYLPQVDQFRTNVDGPWTG